MARLHSAATKTRRTHPASGAKLKLVPPAGPPTAPPLEELRNLRCLVLQGHGHQDCPEFYAAIDAMVKVAQVLGRAMERAGRIGEEIGMVEKSWTYRNDEAVWEWKVQVLVPNSITATAVELSKHLAGPSQLVAPISLVPVCGYTVH